MTIPEEICKYMRKKYEIKYTVTHVLIFKQKIGVCELVKIRRYLKGHKIHYANIIVE